MMRRRFWKKGGGGSGGKGQKNDEGAAVEESKAASDDGNSTEEYEGLMSFKVTVPSGVQPGQTFQVFAGKRIIRIRCPEDSGEGQSLQIFIPKSEEPEQPADSPNVKKLDDQSYSVTIPDSVGPNMQFPVTIRGQQLMVTCPPNGRPGMNVRITPPPMPDENDPTSQSPHETQMFEAVVPQGVSPGQPFALVADGVRVLVTCPPNASPGQTVRFNLPIGLTKRQDNNISPAEASSAARIRLSYDRDVWTRTIRVSDMRFQWVRMDDRGEVDTLTPKVFDIKKTAFVRSLHYIDRVAPNDLHEKSTVSLVPASQAAVDSKVVSVFNSSIVIPYSDIVDAQRRSFDEKAEWFHSVCKELTFLDKTNQTRHQPLPIRIRRDYILEESMYAIMALNTTQQLQCTWRFEYENEEGIDAGGLTRDWFYQITSKLFNPDMGLWRSSITNQRCMQINPGSAVYCAEDHLVYFRFLGRVMGKALFENQLVNGHMVQFMYKHLLGWPVTFQDLKLIDDDFYKNLKMLTEGDADFISNLCLEFSVTEEVMDEKKSVDLIPDGSNVPVTKDNLPEYLETNLKYHLMKSTEEQMNALFMGFFDVIPEPLLTVFDFQELELLMCGVPQIDMEDWRNNSDYTGVFEQEGRDHEVCRWFWEIVEEFDGETKARLLQFVTGTSGVPAGGFGVLHGYDGSIRLFTLHGAEMEPGSFPKAHTCFNRLDVPLYNTKDELEEKLKVAVTMVRFDIE